MREHGRCAIHLRRHADQGLGLVEHSGLRLCCQRTTKPDARSFLAALLACSGLADEETAKELDGKLVKASSLERTVAIHAEAARMPSHTVVSWSTIIQGYANNDEDEMALAYYERMQARGIPPDNRTFSALLAACLSLASREAGREIDGKVVKVESLRKGMSVQSQMDKFECGSNVILASSLVHFYARCGRLDKASAVFDAMLRRDEIVWNTLIMGYVENGEYDRALELFSRMRLERRWSSRAFVAALMACSKVAASEKGVEVDGRFVKMDTLQKGMQIHREAVGCGCDSDEFVASSLLDMYAKCGSMMDARAAFDKMASHDVVSWTSLILGYAESGQGQVALDLFSQMKDDSPVTPNHLTCIAALTASGNLPSLETGKRTHGCILRRGLETDFMIESSVLDCYCKCGSMDNAELVFSSMATRRLVTWSALIAGYSRQGDTTLVFQHFQQLRDEGLQPNGVTVLSVLTSCSHSGLVDKGKKILDAMLPEFGVKPEMDHYHCVLDLLSRANRLDDAVKLARSLRYEDNYFAWTTILSGACKWNNLGVGEVAFESLMKVEDKDDDAAFVLMANLYGRAGLWDKRARISAMRKGNFKLSW